MALTWKDGVTTLLAFLVIGFTYLMAIGYKMPLTIGFRWATVVLLVLGIGMCALSSYTPGSTPSVWITFASVLGSLALILILAGIVTGSKMIFITLGVTIFLLWLVATLRHLLGL